MTSDRRYHAASVCDGNMSPSLNDKKNSVLQNHFDLHEESRKWSKRRWLERKEKKDKKRTPHLSFHVRSRSSLCSWAALFCSSRLCSIWWNLFTRLSSSHSVSWQRKKHPLFPKLKFLIMWKTWKLDKKFWASSDQETFFHTWMYRSSVCARRLTDCFATGSLSKKRRPRRCSKPCSRERICDNVLSNT